MMSTVLKLSLALGALSLSVNSLHAGKWAKLEAEDSRESLLRKIGATAEALQNKYLKDKTELNQKNSQLWSTAETLVLGNETEKSVTDLTKWLNDQESITSLRAKVKALKKTVKPEKEADVSINLPYSYDNNMGLFDMNLYIPGSDLAEENIDAKMGSMFKDFSNIEVDTSFLDSSSGIGSASQSEGPEDDELSALKRDISKLSIKIDNLRAQLAVFADPETEAAQAVAKAKTVDRDHLSSDEKQYFHEYNSALFDLERTEATKGEYEVYLKENYTNQ